MTWRTEAATIIGRVIAETGAGDPKKLRAALRDAYPYFERSRYPYKVWCEEVRRRLGRPLTDRPAKPGPQPDCFT